MFKPLINKGIFDGLSVNEQRKVRLLNIITLVCIFIVTLFFLASVLFPVDPNTQTEDVISQSVNLFMFILVYWLSSKGWHYVSRIIFVIWFTLFLSMLALLVGTQLTASYLSIIPVGLMVIFLFERKFETLLLFLFCFGVFISIILNERYLFIPRMPIAGIDNYNIFYFIECAMAFFLIFSVGSIFKSEHQRFESEITMKNEELEVQKQDIISSMEYSKKIQLAILPHSETIARNIPLSFIMYKPKQIVSGDFYWFHEIDRDNYIIVCADCTGHGIPGAFMTVICCTALNQVVIENKVYSPSQILQEVDKSLSFTLRQESQKEDHIRDGMDLSMIAVNKVKKEIRFTSAKRPAFFVRDGKIQDIKGSKVSIGGLREGEKKFEEIIITYQDNDLIYMYTDGMTDQFGGPDNKKFMTRRFRELVESIIKLPVEEQKNKIDAAFENWRGNYEQTDDVCVIGIKF